MNIAPSAVSSARPPSAPRAGRGAARPGARWLTLLVLIGMTATMLIQPSPMPLGQAASAAGSGPVNGTVKGTAFYDRNNDGYYDGPTNSYQFIPDSGLGGVVVRAFDSTGAFVGGATTAADGTYTLTVTGAATNDLRIEFSFDAEEGPLAGFRESLSNSYASFAGQSFGAVRFVKVNATKVDYGLHKPEEFCLNNPGLITCLQPMGDASGNGVVTFSARRLTATVAGSAATTGNNDVPVQLDKVGAVFGIGVDPAPHRRRTSSRPANVFMGTYVKRHSEYGPSGATNTIYHVTVPQSGTGTVVPFITLPGTLPVHDPDPAPGLEPNRYTADTAIFSRVGRIGLGDVDVMDDATTLLAVDMDETAPKLYFIPIIEDEDSAALSAGVPAPVAIPRPSFTGVPCVGEWHPMGIGTRGDRILVGGVCGAEDTVTPELPNGPHPTQSAAFVLEYFGARDGTDAAFSTIFGVSLGYERGCAYSLGCNHATSKVGDLYTADWGAWNEYPRYNTDASASNPQAMLANIEIADNGDLILGFRDRFADQVQVGSAAWSDAYLADSTYTPPPFPYAKATYNFAAGDLLRVCSTGGVLSLESDGTCASLAGSGHRDFTLTKEFYYDNYAHAENGALHAETINGSTATIPGYDGVWVTAYDIGNINQQGVLSLGNCDDRLGAGDCYPSNSTEGYGSRIGGIVIPSGFAKGNGLADLEVLCDEAPVAIRSTIWRDLDGDGIRDAGEPGIAGVTVRLYDAEGELVATAITDANGIFVFTSDFDGGNNALYTYIRSGLIAEQEGFTIRLDNPADYEPGGPLHGLYPTVTGSTTPTPLDDESLIDSDGTLVSFSSGGETQLWPTIALDPLEPGEHNSEYSLGFVNFVPPVALSGTLWIDADGDGIRDEDEVPLAGVVIVLYKADGVTPVFRSDGSPATATTAADGSYFIDDLEPGDYRALFILPDGFLFTVPEAGSDTTVDSDAIATQDPLQGLTAVFTIDAAVTGGTIADTDPDTKAWYVHPAIDAGVIQVVAMGDYVWIDTDGDGVQDAGEPPLEGVVVTLYNPDGTRALDVDGNVVEPAVTDEFGYYFIDNLRPGEYYATFAIPSGYAFTTTGSGTSATDSDPSPSADDPLLGVTPVFSITAAVSGDTVADTDAATRASFVNPTIDAGVVVLVVPPILVNNTVPVPEPDPGPDPVEPTILERLTRNLPVPLSIPAGLDPSVSIPVGTLVALLIILASVAARARRRRADRESGAQGDLTPEEQAVPEPPTTGTAGSAQRTPMSPRDALPSLFPAPEEAQRWSEVDDAPEIPRHPEPSLFGAPGGAASSQDHRASAEDSADRSSQVFGAEFNVSQHEGRVSARFVMTTSLDGSSLARLAVGAAALLVIELLRSRRGR